MFLTKDDLLPSIKAKHINELTEGDDNLVDQAIADAISQVRDFLATGYNVQLVFSRTGTERDEQVKRWVRFIAIFRLYDRTDDTSTPDKVKTNYDDTVSFLQGVADGTNNLELPRRLAEETGQPNTKFRGGTDRKRSL